jgi:CTP synthase
VAVHVTLVPFIPSAGEVKTKPTQHSVARLREIGLQPDILVCRCDRSIPKSARRKIALFCNVAEENVIEAPDARSVYEVPLFFADQNLDGMIAKRLKLRAKKRDLSAWKAMLKPLIHPSREVEIAVVGKYVKLRDSYKSIDEALIHGGIANDCRVNTRWVEAEDLEKRGADSALDGVHGVLVPGGFGMRGVEGKLQAVAWARENRVPFFGICLGMQCAVIEFARNVAGLDGANSSEFDPETLHPVIDLLPGQDLKKLGGTMRLGLYDCRLSARTAARKAYGKTAIKERHRHRYEFNNRYRKYFAKLGMRYSGVNPQANLVEIVELKGHPWYVACQFHPEFLSRPARAHPLFRGFVDASLAHQGKTA